MHTFTVNGVIANTGQMLPHLIAIIVIAICNYIILSLSLSFPLSCTYTHTHARTHARTHTHTHAHTHAHTHMHLHTESGAASSTQ